MTIALPYRDLGRVYPDELKNKFNRLAGTSNHYLFKCNELRDSDLSTERSELLMDAHFEEEIVSKVQQYATREERYLAGVIIEDVYDTTQPIQDGELPLAHLSEESRQAIAEHNQQQLQQWRLRHRDYLQDRADARPWYKRLLGIEP